MKVFISSTSVDLAPHRQLVAQVVERLGQQSVWMEAFGARSNDPQTVCFDEIAEADIFVGIYAHRYGHVPEGSAKSITEQEFELALERGIPTLCFLVDEDYAWVPAHIDAGSAHDRLKAFKDRIRASRVIDVFTSPQDLAVKVSTSLGRQLLLSLPQVMISVPVARAAEARTKAVEIISLNQVVSPHQTIPADPTSVSGRLDVIVRVNSDGLLAKAIGVSVSVGSHPLSQQQALGAIGKAGSPLVLTFSFNTTLFNANTGAPSLPNGSAVVEATLVLKDGRTETATAECRIANADSVVVGESFAGYVDPRGVMILTKTTDDWGYDWRHGSVTVFALPVMYSARRLASLVITLPGASNPTVVLTAPPSAPSTVTWSGTKVGGATPSVAGLVLKHPTLFEANGTTPKGVAPIVFGIGESGEKIDLAVLNGTLGIPDPAFRLDNADPFKYAPADLRAFIRSLDEGGLSRS